MVDAVSLPVPVVFLLEDLEFGGTQTQTLELASRLDRTRFTPTLVTLRAGSGALAAKAVASGLPWLPLTADEALHLPRSLHALWRYLARERPPLLQLLTVLPNIWGRVFGRCLGLPGIIGCCRGEAAVRGQHERFLGRIPAAHVANAGSIRDLLITGARVPAGQVFYIPNGVDTDYFIPAEKEGGRDSAPADCDRSPSGTAASSARECDSIQGVKGPVGPLRGAGGRGHRLCAEPQAAGGGPQWEFAADGILAGSASGGMVVVCIARLVPVKNHRLLLDAFARVLPSFPDASLLLVGEGECKAELQQRAAADDLRGRVLFHPGVTDVRPFLHRAGLFVLSSDHEGTPNALLEAMACGLPVVATEAGGCVEAIEHERSGLLVPRRDAPALAGAMARLLGDAAERAAFGRAARARVVAVYSMRAMVGAHEAIYERLLRGAARQGRA